MKKFGALLSVMVILAACGIAVADTDTTYQENSFSVWSTTNGRSIVNDVAADGGQAVKLTKNNTGTLTVTSEISTNLKIRVKGNNCNGWPTMRVTMNGVILATKTINNSAYAVHAFDINVPAGTQELKIGFLNQFDSWFIVQLVCSRTLWIDSVTFTVQDAPTTTSEIPTTTTTTPTTTVTPPPVGSDYVAMGDSYSAGWGAVRSPSGVDPTASYDGSDCGRSNNSAQYGVASAQTLNLINVACSQSVVSHITTTSQFGQPPQMERITENTKLITMTTGGNDTSLMYILEVCVKIFNCVRADWFGNNYLTQMDQKIRGLQAKIDGMLKKILLKKPDVIIRIAGYPYMLPPSGEPKGTCSSWLTSGEQATFAKGVVDTNNAIKRAVDGVKLTNPTANVAYVDPLALNSPFMARDGDGQMRHGCSTSPNRYMVGTEIALANGGWHPTNIGQDYYKQIYLASLS